MDKTEVERLFGNCDEWGAAEWFERLANAVMDQDKAVVAGNKMQAETYRMIAASSAMELVRGYRTEIREALARTEITALCDKLASAIKERDGSREAWQDAEVCLRSAESRALAAEAERDAAFGFISDLVNMQSGQGWSRSVVREAAANFLAGRGVKAPHGPDKTPDMIARAAIAAYEAAKGGGAPVAVKPLEWSVERRHGFSIHTGRGLGLKYEAAIKAYSPGWIVTLGESAVVFDSADAGEDEAKAAAQADYEARIRSALAHPSDAALRGRVAELEAVLDGLSSFFGAGTPSEPLSPQAYDRRIREGVEITYAPMVEAWQRSRSEGKR